MVFELLKLQTMIANSAQKEYICLISKPEAMKRILALAVLALFGVTAQAQQNIHSENISEFNAIELSGKMVVELIPASTSMVDITLHNSQPNKLEWKVEDGVLSIRLKPGGGTASSADVQIHYNASISQIKVAEASLKVHEVLESPMLDIDLSAGATLTARVEGMDLSLKATGNSAANLTGNVKYYTLTAGSKSKVNSTEMSCVDTRVMASSGADVYIQAEERLQIVSETGASVYYKGEPEILRITAKMMGTINNIGK